MMEIRKAEEGDIPSIMEIFECARKRMRLSGNMTQWVNYPTEVIVMNDIAGGNLYAMEETAQLCGVFAFILGEDPTYRKIDGAWLNDEPYGTVHRIAGNGRTSGIFARCVEFCGRKTSNLRIDTHRDNHIMLHLLEKYGFKRCGIITVRDGTPRIAFQKILK